MIDSGNKTRLDLWPSSDLVADCVWLAGCPGRGRETRKEQSKSHSISFYCTRRNDSISRFGVMPIFHTSDLIRFPFRNDTGKTEAAVACTLPRTSFASSEERSKNDFDEAPPTYTCVKSSCFHAQQNSNMASEGMCCCKGSSAIHPSSKCLMMMVVQRIP